MNSLQSICNVNTWFVKRAPKVMTVVNQGNLTRDSRIRPPFQTGRYKSWPGSPRIGPNRQSGSDQLGSTKNYESYKTKTFYPYCRLNVSSRNCHNQVQSIKVSQRFSVAWSGVHPPFCFTSANSTRIVALQVPSIYGSHHGPTWRRGR